jgi:hypothetical protein
MPPRMASPSSWKVAWPTRMNDWYLTSKLTIRLTVDDSAVVAVIKADGHCCLQCCGDCCHCVGLIIIVVLHLHHCHCTPFPQCDSPPPIGPRLDSAVVVWSVHDNPTTNAILVNTTMMPAHADCQGWCWRRPIGIILILEMSAIIVAVNIAFGSPVASSWPLPPHSHLAVHHPSAPPPDRHPLLPRQLFGRLPTSKPTIFLLFMWRSYYLSWKTSKV